MNRSLSRMQGESEAIFPRGKAKMESSTSIKDEEKYAYCSYHPVRRGNRE